MERMCRIIFRLFAFTSDTSPFVIRQPTIHNYIKPSYYILHDSIDKYHKYSFDNVFEYNTYFTKISSKIDTKISLDLV